MLRNFRSFACLVFVCILDSSLAKQTPFRSENSRDKFYGLKWPVHKVAIIGAGPSGMISYRELTHAGFDVQVFERDNVPGGNWHYTEETPLPAPIPNVDVVVGDYVPSLPPDDVELPFTRKYIDDDGFEERRREHRGPKPVWKSLTSNAPSPWQQISELPWPAGTPWELTHSMLRNYMRSFASFHGINSNDDNPNIFYNTRVELVEKYFHSNGTEHGWTLTLKRLVRTAENSSEVTWWTERFDAVVVATGRFNAPFIPTIPGLAEWNKQFGDRILHSRAYRHPAPYINETVLIVGAATSGSEISRDLSPFVKKIYQSIRPDNVSVPHSPYSQNMFLRRLPKNVTIVPAIESFHPISPGERFAQGKIQLTNGTIITGIDRIIFATGFRYSFPFLPQYHNSSIGINETAPAGTLQLLVTDGTHIRSLHLDLFYIEEPTIGFINMNLGMQSFTYAEYLAVALAKVWDDKAKLPSTRELWRLYQDRLDDYGGYSKHFQFLGSKRTDEKIRFFVGWLNDAAVKYGGRQIDGVPKKPDIFTLWANARFGSDIELEGSEVDMYGDPFSPSTSELPSERKRERITDAIFNDYW